MPNWISGIVAWAKANPIKAFFAGAGVLLLLYVMFGPEGGQQGPQQVVEEDLFGGEAFSGDVTTAKALSQMQAGQEVAAAEMRNLRGEVAQLRSVVRLQKDRVDVQDLNYERRLDDALSRGMAAAVEELAVRQSDVVAPTAAPPPPRLRILRPGGGAAPAGPAAAVEKIVAADAAWVHLPAGSVVAGEIITGAFATKARGDGLPVLAQLQTAYLGPNGYEVPLEGCMMIGKATADMQTIRARVEAVTLSCVLPDGTSFDRKVRGYFTGEDGTLGVPGTWQFRTGAWLGNLLASMGITGSGVYGNFLISEALGDNAVIFGDPTAETTERLQEFFLKRAEEILPVVWVETQTPVYVVMLEGVTIEGLPEMAYVPRMPDYSE